MVRDDNHGGRTGSAAGRIARMLGGLVLLALLAGLGWRIAERLREEEQSGGSRAGDSAVAVEVASVEIGTIVDRRTFHGTLHARAQFSVAAKISGRVERVHVDVGDRISRGALVAELDDAEHQQTVLEVEAEVAVARARLAEARTALDIAERDLRRVEALEERGVASDAELDARRSDLETRQAALAVAEAEVKRQEVLLVTARIRRDYTRVNASWSDGDEERVVGERFVDEGDNVVAHQPIVTVLDLGTIVALVTVTEADYGQLELGQPAVLRTDAFPGRTFAANIVRKAPLFRTESRQADVELHATNPDGELKPGMFIRATVELGRAEGAAIVPQLALAMRGEEQGVFLVDESLSRATWQAVEIGIMDAGRVQIRSPELRGLVVTLGQQLLTDGSPVTVPEPPATVPERARE